MGFITGFFFSPPYKVELFISIHFSHNHFFRRSNCLEPKVHCNSALMPPWQTDDQKYLKLQQLAQNGPKRGFVSNVHMFFFFVCDIKAVYETPVNKIDYQSGRTNVQLASQRILTIALFLRSMLCFSLNLSYSRFSQKIVWSCFVLMSLNKRCLNILRCSQVCNGWLEWLVTTHYQALSCLFQSMDWYPSMQGCQKSYHHIYLQKHDLC